VDGLARVLQRKGGEREEGDGRTAIKPGMWTRRCQPATSANAVENRRSLAAAPCAIRGPAPSP
jgi:hypothetical protein